MNIVRDYYVIGEACAEASESQWLYFAKDFLALIQIQVSAFACAVRTLFEIGRGKHRNIHIVGPATSSKMVCA